MEYNAPHPGAVFEGYYNKFKLPSGAHLVIVLCKVQNAETRPNAFSVTYVPRDVSKLFQIDLFPDKLEMTKLNGRSNAFIINVPGVGYAKWNSDSSTEYSFKHADWSFEANVSSRTPWSENVATPEGSLVHLPLPLHWHVQSLSSECRFSLAMQDYDLPAEDASGQATVHQEKNWAHSFPSAHMWVQAREGERGLCCAGGQILGMEAFLLGYRSKGLSIDFRPPFAVRVFGMSPFMSYKVDWENRQFVLSLQSFRQKITIKAQAPKGSFFSLSPPFPEGHRKNFLGQTFEAVVEVSIYQSGWLSPWRLVREDVFEGASLEFGGGFYPPAGSSQRIN